MKVILKKNAGFCKGVRAAYDKALELAEKYGKIYTVGELIHNESVVDFLKSKGVYSVDPADAETLEAGSVALIRAHGITIELEEKLRAKGIILFDATCPVVKRNQRIVEERAAAGDEILIVGDKNHDEVLSVASRAGSGVKIFSDAEEPDFGDKNVSVVFQTTVLAEKFEKVCALAEKFRKTHANSVGIFNTICYTTKARQDETRALAGNSDAVAVLGSRSSANTRRLYQVALSVNPNTFFIERASDAEAIIKKDFQCISIAAGASTPPWLIQEVTELMSETQKTAVENTAIETEVTKEATLQEKNSKAEESAPEKELTMEDVMASNPAAGRYTNYKVGKRVKGSVISADSNGIFIAVGGKKDGFIDKADTSVDGNYDPADYKAGDPIEAIITSVEKDYVCLSKKEVDALRAEEAEAEKALAAGEFSLEMTEVVKGGLRGRMGQYTVFVPASQIRMGYVKNLEDYKGKTLRLTLMPPKEKEKTEGEENTKAQGAAEVSKDKPARKSRYLFASQRMILEKEKKEKEDIFWDNIHIHDIVEGKVKRFTAFGAFVNVRGFDCLAHISELSWNKINEPGQVLKIGETYDFVVLKMDRETGKISLGYKQLQKKPYEVAAETYPVGTVIKGKVERIFPYGAFISIADGVDGLVHVSQISHNWIKDANEALKVGEEVDAKIIGFEENRITLSIKELLPAPEEGAANDTYDSVEEGDAPKRQSRIKKFEQKLAEGENKRERRPRKEASGSEPKEWVSGSSSATLGDLFKNLNLNIADEEPAAEEAAEAPAEETPKKTMRKKKVVETEETAETTEE